MQKTLTAFSFVEPPSTCRLYAICLPYMAFENYCVPYYKYPE